MIKHSHGKLMISVQETFQQTIQGEGYWVGTPVDFIRLWGCPVGCWFCDTGYSEAKDYGKTLPRTQRSIDELLAELKSPHVVISGGEPFIHPQLPELTEAILATGHRVSIETSGVKWRDISSDVWVTLSPKEHLSPGDSRFAVDPGMWLQANEIKIVISDGNEIEFYQSRGHLDKKPCPIYLQPEASNLEVTIPLTLTLLRQHPTARLSLQIHKIIGVR